MKNFLINMLVAVAFCVLSGCSGDVLKTAYSGDSGFAFASSVLNVEVSDADGNQIYVPVYRGSETFDTVEIDFEYDISESGSSDPEWADADPDGIFSLISRKIIFAEGSNTAYALVRFKDINSLGTTEKYRIRLSLKNDVSPSGRDRVVMSVNRKLTFDLVGECDYFDACIFEKSYKAEIYVAREAEIYRVADPYTEGLIAEEYAANGWMGTPSEYVQFTVDGDGYITYEPFCTGLLVEGKYNAYAYYPSTYMWGKDFSEFDSQNKKLSDKVLQLYPVYCLPDFQYGFLNDGAYPVTITLP